MNSRDSSSVSTYSMQWISCLPSNNANRQRPIPARIVPFVVMRIGSATDWSFSRAASLNSSIAPVQQLGIPRFSELYVRGFLDGGSYEAIPLEVNAYALGGRFEQNPANRFSVEDEVRRWIAEGGL